MFQEVTAESLAMRGLMQHRRHHKPVSLSFLPPTSVSVLGSYALHTMTRSDCVVDVGVEMPAACFHDRDLKAYIYADKRALYLGVLAKHLEGHASISSLKFEAFGQRVEKPALLLGLGGALAMSCDSPCERHFTWFPAWLGTGSKSPFSIRLIPLIPLGIFKRDLLLAGHGNVNRASHEGEPQPATPVYNASICEDMYARDLQTSIRNAFSRCPVAVDAVVLLKVASGM